ncbi:hypothetical protein T484DRAFT_1862518 [Baffinella frigidus]|nr:hypothetical protein T484DRAFT_1862518 [Cryptophyta sp. CCMP2293]
MRREESEEPAPPGVDASVAERDGGEARGGGVSDVWGTGSWSAGGRVEPVPLGLASALASPALAAPRTPAPGVGLPPAPAPGVVLSMTPASGGGLSQRHADTVRREGTGAPAPPEPVHGGPLGVCGVSHARRGEYREEPDEPAPPGVDATAVEQERGAAGGAGVLEGRAGNSFSASSFPGGDARVVAVSPQGGQAWDADLTRALIQLAPSAHRAPNDAEHPRPHPGFYCSSHDAEQPRQLPSWARRTAPSQADLVARGWTTSAIAPDVLDGWDASGGGKGVPRVMESAVPVSDARTVAGARGSLVANERTV